jgi:hypothetical protein
MIQPKQLNMTATLTFNLPEDMSDYNMYNQASGMFLTLHDIDQKMRDILKYDNTRNEVQLAMVEELRELLHAIMNDHHVTLDL